MNRRSTKQVPESSDIESELQQLREEVRVLRDVIDEIRELIEYSVQNGIPIRSDVPYGVVKQMPLDPCDPDWRSRVVIVRTAEEAKEWNEELVQREASEVAPPEDTTANNEAKSSGMLF